MKLGSGVARVKRMMSKGLSVGLGADSVNAGTIYSIFEQMKLSVLLPRSVWAADDWVLPSEAFAMATQGGARALLLDEAIGSIEEGKKADLVILCPSPGMRPNNAPLDQLALCENGASVETVFIAGKPVMRERKFNGIDEEGILASLSQMQPRINSARFRAQKNRASLKSGRP
jgi:cytosine/adenosine deaminase-related metal-dependent hydrolase